ATRGMGSALLEIGCGYGYFLAEAAAFFDRRVGTEMAEAAATIARRHADSIYVGGVEAVPPGSTFDCIVALHVIEHIYRPVEFLRRVHQSLVPGGSILLAGPDMGSFWRTLLGRRWPGFKFPEHVVFYDARSLRGLMARAGLASLERISYPHAFPLAQVCRKLGLAESVVWPSLNVWLPATTVAVLGRSSDTLSG